MKKLRIAQIAPFWFSVPPKDYGGTERVVSYITEELVKRGHDVTLFARSDSQTKAKLVSPLPEDLAKSIKAFCDPAYHATNTFFNAEAFKRADEFDIIHSHAGFFSFYFSDLVKTPVIHTLHNQLPRADEIENELYRKYKHLNFVSISQEFQSHFDLNYVANAYHGLPLELFPYSARGGEGLLWLGRASKNKGELDAIEAARQAGMPLKVAASVRPDTVQYFEKEIKPRLTDQIQLVQNVRFEDTPKLYGAADAFVFPVHWKEPFGLIMIEAMSCGTPVIAYNRGSVPEIVQDGVTGFIIDPGDESVKREGSWIIKKKGIAGLVEAIGRIKEIDRAACRKHVEANFTVSKMVDRYEKIYENLASVS